MKLFQAIAVTLAVTVAPSPLKAQNSSLPTTPLLRDIVLLAQDGHVDSARAMISLQLNRLSPDDPLYPEALYTAGTIASSGDDAQLYFARVAVEHGRSSWADRALLRLAQLDYGRGDPAGTVARVERLMNDYPGSAVTADAALWGARAAFESGDADRACGWLSRGLASVGDNVEVRNQIEFTQKRCPTTQPITTRPVVDSLRAKPEPTPSPEVLQPQEPPAGPWRVQVAALTDESSISRAERAILDAGFRVYRVPGPRGMTKLQAGPFTSRAEALAEVERLGRAIGSSPFVVRVDQ